MAKKYGVTTWGAELLRALEQKTDYGRLGRGKTYANTEGWSCTEFRIYTVDRKYYKNIKKFNEGMIGRGFNYGRSDLTRTGDLFHPKEVR